MKLATLDTEMYNAIFNFATELRQETAAAEPTASTIAEAFLVREARLLDDANYAAWIELFATDALYWVPSSNPVENPRVTVSYLLDDRRRLEDRIALFDTGWSHAQTPPSRTKRIVSGVEAWTESDGSLRVRASGVTYDWRRDVMETHPVTLMYRLRADGDDWKVVYRIVHRLDCDGPTTNISYII